MIPCNHLSGNQIFTLDSSVILICVAINNPEKLQCLKWQATIKGTRGVNHLCSCGNGCTPLLALKFCAVIGTLNFSMGFNIISPYIDCVSHKWSLHKWVTLFSKKKYTLILSSCSGDLRHWPWPPVMSGLSNDKIKMTRGWVRWPRDLRKLGWFSCARHSGKSVCWISVRIY